MNPDKATLFLLGMLAGGGLLMGAVAVRDWHRDSQAVAACAPYMVADQAQFFAICRGDTGMVLRQYPKHFGERDP